MKRLNLSKNVLLTSASNPKAIQVAEFRWLKTAQRVALSGLFASAILFSADSLRAQQPFGTPQQPSHSKLNSLGRFLGVGWSDGYHACPRPPKSPYGMPYGCVDCGVGVNIGGQYVNMVQAAAPTTFDFDPTLGPTEQTFDYYEGSMSPQTAPTPAVRQEVAPQYDSPAPSGITPEEVQPRAVAPSSDANQDDSLYESSPSDRLPPANSAPSTQFGPSPNDPMALYRAYQRQAMLNQYQRPPQYQYAPAAAPMVRPSALPNGYPSAAAMVPQYPGSPNNQGYSVFPR